MRPTKGRSDESMVKTFTDIYAHLKTKNLQPKLHVLDNECSKAVQTFIKSNGTDIHIVEPYNHSVNTVEHAVKAIKYHVIIGLATVDINCPLQLWDLFLAQMKDTLNLLRTSRRDPTKSAYEEMEGKFDFNWTPISILGTEALAFVNPDERTSWEAHWVDCYVTGRCLDHYHLLNFFVTHTKWGEQNRHLPPLPNKLQSTFSLRSRLHPPCGTTIFAINKTEYSTRCSR